MSREQDIKDFEILRVRHQKLKEEKVKIETTLQISELEYKKVKEEAELKFGTSDVEELLKIVSDIRKENNENITTFKENIEFIERELEKIDKEIK